MKKNSTLLSRQKRIIIILTVFVLVLAATYFSVMKSGREDLQMVLKYDSAGDEVEAIITDVSGEDRGINITYLNSVLSGKAQNRHNVKKGKTQDVLCTFEADNVKITYYPLIFPEVPLNSISYVAVTNDYGYFKVYADPVSGDFIIEQARKNLYDTETVSELLLQARYMLADKRLDNPSENLADYGLAESQKPVKIEICDKSGNVNTVFMGDKAPGGGYYMKHKDKEHVYLADNFVSIFENDVNYHLNPVLTSGIPQEYAMYISSLTYHRYGEELFTCEIIPDTERVGTLKNQLHRIVSPENKKKDILSTTTFYEMLSSICSLSGVSVLEYDVSEKENYEEIMTKYGFDNPIAQIVYSFGDAQHFVVFGGSVTDPNTNEKFYYGYGAYDTIVLVPAAAVSFLEYEYIDYINNKMFQHNIDDVAKITLTDGSGSRVFETMGSGKNLQAVEANSGKSLHVPSFRQFYIALLNVGVDGYSEIDAGVDVNTLEHDLTFEIQLKSGETLRYAFYSESTLRCYTVINGVGEFYTKREYVDKIKKYADMLMSGEVIESQI